MGLRGDVDPQTKHGISIHVAPTGVPCVAVFDNGHGIHSGGCGKLDRHCHLSRPGYVQSTDRVNI
jgi:hypothetical protein